MKRPDAVVQLAKEQPEMHRLFIAEYNRQRGFIYAAKRWGG